jgi:hypothetical protein
MSFAKILILFHYQFIYVINFQGLLLSTFGETMLIDLDVVWFKQPDTVFNYKGYKSSGALFFRDRNYVTKTVPKGRADPGDIMRYLKSNNVTIDAKNAEFIINNHLNSYPLYWRYVLGNGPFAMEGYQDSSLLIVNKSKHPKLLIALRRIIFETRLGYGDKELFWLAATVSKENFVFEPFLAGQYGDCYGLMLHFDPNDESLGSGARPLYINAEYMVELKHLKAIGTLLRSEMTVPILVNGSTRILDMGTYSQPKNFTIGLTDSSPDRFRGCTCPKIGCQNITYDINYHLVHSQWLTWSFRQNCKRECVPIRAAASTILADVMKDFRIRNHCYFTGCTSTATLNQSLPWAFNDQYCDHVDFYTKDEPLMMEILAKEARTPFNELNYPVLKDDQLVMCGSKKAIYLFKNISLHVFPNIELLENMGKEIGNIRLIKERLCEKLLGGKPVELLFTYKK